MVVVVNVSGLEDVNNAIKRINKGELDSVILRGLPVNVKGTKTPIAIKGNPESEEKELLKKIGGKLGNISLKGIENSIRFVNDQGITNVETRHGHYQHDYTILFCMRGDMNATTKIVSANTIMEKLPNKEKELLLEAQNYFKNEKAFGLIVEKSGKYGFHHKIFGRSDFEETIKDLDLPDAMKILEKFINNGSSSIKNAAMIMKKSILLNAESIVFSGGDMMIASEFSTIRYSDSYKPSHKDQFNRRWFLACSINVD